MWKNEKTYTIAMLRQFLRYEPDTGHLYWLPRAEGALYGDGYVTARAAAAFNTRCAGKRAERWHTGGYGRVRLFGCDFHASRIAWAFAHGDWPSAFIDHIDGNTCNNRILNLRVVSHRENCMNRKTRVDSPSGHPGVRPRRGKWVARIGVLGKELTLGTFVTFEMAVKARRAAEREYGFHPNTGRAE